MGKCKLETERCLIDALCALEKGYSTGNFESLFPFLAQDCVMESQWVLTPNTGYEAITDYFKGKGNTLAESGNFPECDIVELLGNCNPIKNAAVHLNGRELKNASIGLIYTPGKPCLRIKQTIDEKENIVIVDVSLDESDMVKRIDLCMPELFRYREVDYSACFSLVTDDWTSDDYDYEHSEHLIWVGDTYYEYFCLFMSCIDVYWAEYEDYHIPMAKWIEMLNSWGTLVSSESFDEAFEKIAGVDYDAGTLQNPIVAKKFGEFGKYTWDERENGRRLWEKLIEWTNLYKDTYTYVNYWG